ncbi:hypothetical protein, partial [Stenotrophomonas maltophilia]|uniref:hypothetical protein n=1 Tax=Stenotrophomonas maltophilia TaxID=40324 RepID=UPI00195471FA
ARAVQRAETEKRALAPVLEPWTLFLAAHARTQAADAGHLAGAYFAETARRCDGFFSDYDVRLTPVVDDEPPALGQLGPDVAGPRMWD